MTTLLDDLSGYEFEDAVASLFRELGYVDVAVATRVADEGRDITMYDGGTAYVVECKHTETVSRPVVQKLHSAVATYEHQGPKRGMVVTSGRFTGPAIEYAERLTENGDPHPIELIDGRDIRELGDSVGMDLYNGRIEIVCEEALPVGDPGTVFADVFSDIENAPPRAVLSDPTVELTYRPIIDSTASTRAVFETSVGVIHRIDRRDRIVVDASPPTPALAPSNTDELADVSPIPFSDADPQYDGETLRFERTESEYREWIKGRLSELLETTVSYTGGNNVTYTKECRPSPRDISIESVQPVYLPRIDAAVTLGSYTHRYQYDAAGDRHIPRTDDVRRCVHCGENDTEGTYTYCENCGSVNCETHTKTERLTEKPVCTGCSVTESFFFAEKHFFSTENAAAFREEYEAMPIHRKAFENPLLAVGIAVVILLVSFAILAFAV